MLDQIVGNAIRTVAMCAEDGQRAVARQVIQALGNGIHGDVEHLEADVGGQMHLLPLIALAHVHHEEWLLLRLARMQVFDGHFGHSSLDRLGIGRRCRAGGRGCSCLAAKPFTQ